MKNIKPVITLMAKSAIKEHKTDDFSKVCERVKAGVLNKMLAGEIPTEEAKELREFISEQERSVRNNANLVAQ